LDYYSIEDIQEIIKRSASILGVGMTGGAIKTLAEVSRFTPRTANRILKRARDVAEVRGTSLVDESCLDELFEILEIDGLGLEYQDRRILFILRDQFGGGPAGVGSLASSLGEEKSVIEGVYEPYLIKIGLIKRTPAGRVLTEKGIGYLENFKNR
jgi:Holliday junction DNA helicase RuvB